MRNSALLVLSLVGCSAAVPLHDQVPLAAAELNKSNIRPLVLWHGLGDSYASPGMLEFAKLLQDVHPGLFVHSVYLDENLDADQRAAVMGNVDEQLELVATQLEGVKELQHGFDAMGFSQGGQFLRAYVERYNSPPVNNLITFGSQHMGIADLPACRPTDFLCKLASRVIKSNAYSHYAQTNIVQAQYFRDPDHLEEYWDANSFLADINNEVAATVNTTYADNLKTLENLILVMFSQDKTVVPKESAWFGSYSPPQGIDGRDEKTIVPMLLQPTYLADTFGLRSLDERGGVSLEICNGEHMQISDDCWKPLAEKYLGGSLNREASFS